MLNATHQAAPVSEQRLTDAGDELGRLQAENARLRDENARLRGQIHELRAVLDAHVARAASTRLYGPVEMTAGTCVGPRRRRNQP